MKKCYKCQELKEIYEFTKNRSNKDGLDCYCKVCRRKASQDYRAANPKKIAEANRDYYQSNRDKDVERKNEWRKANPDKVADQRRRYYEKNKEKISERNSEWQKANKDKVNESNRRWREANPEKVAGYYEKYGQTEARRKSAREWAKRNRESGRMRRVERYHTDEQFNISIKLRRRIHMAIRNQYTEKAVGTIELLGCSFADVKKHIESKFTEGMTWEKLFTGEIHIDHIRPCASFDLTDADQQKECFHYTNLQPLWARDNLSKSGSWEGTG